MSLKFENVKMLGEKSVRLREGEGRFTMFGLLSLNQAVKIILNECLLNVGIYQKENVHKFGEIYKNV